MAYSAGGILLRVARAGRWLRHPAARAAVVGVVGAILFIWLFSPLTFTTGPFTVRVGVAPYWHGETQVVLPPVGRVYAHTHNMPLRFTLELENVDLDQLRTVIETETQAQAIHTLQNKLLADVWHLAVWVLVLALAGGGFMTFLLGERRARHLMAGAFAGLALTAAVIGLTYRSYHVSAFAQPQFSGILKAAPWVVSLLDDSFAHARQFSNQLTMISDNLYKAFAAIDTLQPLPPEAHEVDVMLVSNIHNNPLGFDLIGRMVQTFHPSFILDTGDLVDYGPPTVAELAKRIGSFGVPYVFVPGNHDSPGEINVLIKTPNVKLLSGAELTLDGVTLVGLRDPSSYRDSPDVASPVELRQTAQDLQHLVDTAPTPPLIVAVHNPAVAEGLAGKVPVIAVGRLHQMSVVVRDHTLWLNAGTTGAAGIRGFTTSEEVPYSLLLLHLLPQNGRLVPAAVDEITLANVSGTMTLVRKLLPTTGPNAILQTTK